jgi:hypothetical protein
MYTKATSLIGCKFSFFYCTPHDVTSGDSWLTSLPDPSAALCCTTITQTLKMVAWLVLSQHHTAETVDQASYGNREPTLRGLSVILRVTDTKTLQTPAVCLLAFHCSIQIVKLHSRLKWTWNGSSHTCIWKARNTLTLITLAKSHLSILPNKQFLA